MIETDEKNKHLWGRGKREKQYGTGAINKLTNQIGGQEKQSIEGVVPSPEKKSSDTMRHKYLIRRKQGKPN